MTRPVIRPSNLLSGTAWLTPSGLARRTSRAAVERSIQCMRYSSGTRSQRTRRSGVVEHVLPGTAECGAFRRPRDGGCRGGCRNAQLSKGPPVLRGDGLPSGLRAGIRQWDARSRSGVHTATRSPRHCGGGVVSRNEVVGISVQAWNLASREGDPGGWLEAGVVIAAHALSLGHDRHPVGIKTEMARAGPRN